MSTTSVGGFTWSNWTAAHFSANAPSHPTQAAVAWFNNNFVMVFTDTSNNVSWSTYNMQTANWTSPQPLKDPRVPYGASASSCPSLILYNNVLTAFWTQAKNALSGEFIQWAQLAANSSTWQDQQLGNLKTNGSEQGPAAAAIGQTIMIAYTDVDQNGSQNISYQLYTPETLWGPPLQPPANAANPFQTSQKPALIALPSQAFMLVWKGKGNHLTYAFYPLATGVWSTPQLFSDVKHENWATQSAPNVAFNSNANPSAANVSVVWQGANSSSVWFSTSVDPYGTQWNAQETINGYSSSPGPSLAYSPSQSEMMLLGIHNGAIYQGIGTLAAKR